MPENTTEVPEAAIEAAHEALLAYVDARDLACGSDTLPSGDDPHGAARDALQAAATLLTAPLREELEEAKRKAVDEKFLRETENRRERKDKEAAEERADSTERRLEEATKAISAASLSMEQGRWGEAHAAFETPEIRALLATLQDSQVGPPPKLDVRTEYRVVGFADGSVSPDSSLEGARSVAETARQTGIDTRVQSRTVTESQWSDVDGDAAEEPDPFAMMRPTSAAHVKLVGAVLVCLEKGIEPDTIRRFVEEELPDSQVDRDGEKRWTGYDEVTLRVSRASAIRLEQHLTKTFGESRIVNEIRAQLAPAASTPTPEEPNSAQRVEEEVAYDEERDTDGPARCPDDGACHHNCGPDECFRVRYAAPLSEYGDDWTAEDRAKFATPEQPEEPTCGGLGEVGLHGNPNDVVPCPGCPDCSTQDAGREECPDVECRCTRDNIGAAEGIVHHDPRCPRHGDKAIDDREAEQVWTIWKWPDGQCGVSGPAIWPEDDSLVGLDWVEAAKLEVVPRDSRLTKEAVEKLERFDCELERVGRDWSSYEIAVMEPWPDGEWVRLADVLAAFGDDR